jgi:hypothetical protein
MGRTNIGRGNNSPFRIEPHFVNLSEDLPETQGKVMSNVFDEKPFRFGFFGDSAYMRPEVPGVVFSFFVPCNAERLAGISGRDKIHLSTPRAAIEGCKIVPDRR